MSKTKTQPAASATAAPPSRRYHPALLLLFAGSGCSALIYEIVWYQLLQLVIGSTAISLGVLLATFMGGLCLGSLLLPRYRRPRDSIRCGSTRAWSWASASAAFWRCSACRWSSGIYVAAAAHGMPAILLRALVCAICLLPPTMLMGASLPAVARWLETSAEGVSWMGLLYGGNTAGAVFGCLLAGFYLLRVSDMATATFVAAASTVRGAGQLSAGAAHARTRASPRRRAAADAPATPGLAGLRRHRLSGRQRARAPKWSGRACWA